MDALAYRGCGHGYAYCYVPNVLHMDRCEFGAGANLRPDFFATLRGLFSSKLAGYCHERRGL
jgi:hypothetical protein